MTAEQHNLHICSSTIHICIHAGFDETRELRKIRFTLEAAISIPDLLVSTSVCVCVCTCNFHS
jgi:hypothetical protein